MSRKIIFKATFWWAVGLVVFAILTVVFSRVRLTARVDADQLWRAGQTFTPGVELTDELPNEDNFN